MTVASSGITDRARGYLWRWTGKGAASNMLISIISPIFLFLIVHSKAGQAFEVWRHVSTVARYDVGKDVSQGSFTAHSTVPDGCTPIHLNLVARHGTRSPTKKRMRELDRLADRIEVLLRNVQLDASSSKVPAWLYGWQSPWRGKSHGGELISKGEDELYDLGLRVRERFQNLFNEDYHPNIYVMKATQVPRASASAVAFGIGLFSGKGSLGRGNHRAFSVASESRASDILLRFYDTCESYKDYRKNQEPAVEKLKEPSLDEISSALLRRYAINFTRQDVSSLWFLCKQEASLMNITDQSCSLFTPSEIALLEWTDDLELFILKGYGKSLNYRMGLPLLEDVVQSMEDAIKSVEEKQPPGSCYEKARLRFAHAETVVPFSCLLGLFLDGPDFVKIQQEQSLDMPPKPPQERNWRGSFVAPFGGNNMLVLYSCNANVSSRYHVQVLHNEHPMPLPACDYMDLCPFEVFKERIVAPHRKHDYNSICRLKPVRVDTECKDSKFTRLLRWFFPLGDDIAVSRDL